LRMIQENNRDIMILLFYYEESKNTLTPRFENPMAIFKLVFPSEFRSG